jgi:antitoxin component YwqK of YwqJK toxin-antitoxin module
MAKENKKKLRLHRDITANILSDYIDYDELIEIVKYYDDFKVNPSRVKMSEHIDEDNDTIKEIYIDGDLRKVEVFNRNNIKIGEQNCKNGVREGKQYEWYENGQLTYEFNYKNRVRQGKQYEWYENGQLQLEQNYKNGQEEGTGYEWYHNGQLRSEWNYKNGYLEGKNFFWHKDGKLKSERNYKNGKLQK